MKAILTIDRISNIVSTISNSNNVKFIALFLMILSCSQNHEKDNAIPSKLQGTWKSRNFPEYKNRGADSCLTYVFDNTRCKVYLDSVYPYIISGDTIIVKDRIKELYDVKLLLYQIENLSFKN